MAPCSSNRSPSPMSTRPNPNPNSRNGNPDRENAIRKSFNGNPFPKPSVITHSHGRSFCPTTPANSPADYARRGSFGKEITTSLREYEHKENERDPNSRLIMRAKSPSVSRGAKNFMSPTISAASKTNASPRKKVLAERNEAIRTSASLSDGQFHFYSANSLDAAEENALPVPMESSGVEAFPTSRAADFNRVVNEDLKSSMKNSDKDHDTVDPACGVANILKDDNADSPFKVTKLQGEPDLVVLSPEVPLNFSKSESSTLPDAITHLVSHIQNASSSQSISPPLNADPSILPYDPKTNYLSPRPKFLHYKPNPRIEVYLKKGKQLDDDFTSEASTEMESSAETQSENLLQYEDASSVEMAAKELNPESYESHATAPHLLQEAAESKAVSKWRLLSKSKVMALFFIFLVALLSTLAPHSRVILNAVFEDQTMSKIYHESHMIAEFAKENLASLFQNGRVWSAQFVNYLSRMTPRLRELDKISPLQFSNLTALHDNGFNVAECVEFGPFHEGERKAGLIKEIDSPLILADSNIELLPKIQSTVEFVQHAPLAEGEVIKVDDSGAEFLKENRGLHEGEQKVGPIKEVDSPLILADSNIELVPKMQSNVELEEHVPSAEGEVIKVGDSGAEILKENSCPFPSACDNLQYDPQPVNESEFLVEESEIQAAIQTAALEPKHLEAVGCTHVDIDIVADIQYELHSGVEAEDQLAPLSLEHEGESDLSSCNQFESGQAQEESGNRMQETSVGNFQIFEALGLGDQLLAPSNLGICLVLLTILTTAVFAYMKPKKGSLENSASLVINGFPEKKFVSKSLPLSSNMESSFHISPSCSGPTEVDMNGESCPSEMSSFQKSSSYCDKKGLMGAEEAQSQERKSKRNYKRDSLASSSEYTAGSASYGSFTTYSVVHSKDGDNEVVTPVRRSSRIRNKVTSP